MKRIRLQTAIIGRKECAALLGVKSENLEKIAGLPVPLQKRGIQGFEVAATPLWPRAEIEALRDARAARREAAAA